MQQVLIRNAQATGWGTSFDGKAWDIRLLNGRLVECQPAGALQPTGTEAVVERPALYILPGLVDTACHLTDPGFEYRDTLQTLAASAWAGGYRHVVFLPTSHPTVDNADQLLALQHRAQALPVQAHFMGTVTLSSAGKQMAPLVELHRTGAVAFCDPVPYTGNHSLLLRVLQYLQLVNGLLVVNPLDARLSATGVANEGPVATSLGLEGIPALAEELVIANLIQLLAYAGGRLHLAPITTAGGVQLVRQAKAQGLRLTAGTAPHYLCLTDDRLQGFDPNYKVLPPLRTDTDRQALLNGLLDGTLNCLGSHHNPQSIEEKELEFQQSSFGMLALETALSATYTALKGPPEQTLPHLSNWLSTHPRQLLGLPQPLLQPGQLADFTLFDPATQWVVQREHVHSLSGNSPFLGHTLRGQVVVPA
jgi:dihydroorotase